MEFCNKTIKNSESQISIATDKNKNDMHRILKYRENLKQLLQLKNSEKVLIKILQANRI